jgi:hypothetical protein
VAVGWVRAVALTLLGLGGLLLVVPGAPMTGDGQFYIAFVRNGLQHGASSWHERRLLGPWLVSRLPLDPQTGFFVLTVASLAVAALLTWRAAEALVAGNHGQPDANEARALVSIPLVLATWIAAPNLREYGLVDPLAWAFVAAVWLLTIRQRWFGAAVVAAIGVLAKEVVVLAALAAAAAAWQPRRPWLAPLVAAPAVIVVLGLTLLFPGSGSDARAYVLKWIVDGLGSLGLPRIVFLVFAAYGALWLLVPRGWQPLPPHVRRAGLAYVAAAVVLPLVGSPERMEEAVFPFVVTCAVLAMRDWMLPAAWLLAVGNLAFVARVGGDARLPSALAWMGLAVACAVVGLGYVRPRLVRRARPPSRAGAAAN